MDRLDWLGAAFGALCVAIGVGAALALRWRSRRRPAEPVDPWIWPQAWWPLPMGVHFLISGLEDHVEGAWSDVLQYVQYAAWAAMIVLAWWWVRAFRAHLRRLARTS